MVFSYRPETTDGTNEYHTDPPCNKINTRTKSMNLGKPHGPNMYFTCKNEKAGVFYAKSGKLRPFM